MDEQGKPTKKRRGRPPKVKPKAEPEEKPSPSRRRTVFWSAVTHKDYERNMRSYLVALNVSQAGQDHIADVKVVDERAQVVIGMINKHRGLK
jgi:hypothetical protein